MKLFIDSANLNELKNMEKALFISGVTTNPKLIAKGLGKREVNSEEYLNYLAEIRKMIGGEMFIQLTSRNREDMVQEANAVKDMIRGPIVFKIPADKEGFSTIAYLAKEDIDVAATAVYTAFQAYLAIASGAKYVIPYFSRIDQHDKQGIEAIREIMSISGPEKLLVASVKGETSLYYLMLEGVRNFTLPHSLIAQISECDLTQEAINEFTQNLKINWSKKKK